jgi:hypothetical protein
MKYEVTIQRVEYKEATIIVEAEDEEEAEEVAIEEVADNDYELCNANEDVTKVDELE